MGNVLGNRYDMRSDIIANGLLMSIKSVKIEKSKGIRCLDVTMLKIIAMISMVIDHVGNMIFPELLWLRMIGRLAMPVFAFCITEGYIHTRNRKKYLLRMGIFALISEVPFDLAFEDKIGLSHQNIMVSFFISIVALMLFDLIRGSKNEIKGRYSVLRTMLGALAVLAMAVVAFLVKADYTIFAVASVFLFYAFKDVNPYVRPVPGIAFLALTRNVGYYCTTGLSLIPLLLYNGKKGKGLKWLFYVFYPGHLLLLYVLKLILAGN